MSSEAHPASVGTNHNLVQIRALLSNSPVRGKVETATRVARSMVIKLRPTSTNLVRSRRVRRVILSDPWRQTDKFSAARVSNTVSYQLLRPAIPLRGLLVGRARRRHPRCVFVLARRLSAQERSRAPRLDREMRRVPGTAPARRRIGQLADAGVKPHADSKRRRDTTASLESPRAA